MVDSFSLYCLATEVDPAEMLRVLGLIELRLADDASRADNRLYKGALLARIGMQQNDPMRRHRYMAAGLGLMRGARPSALLGGLTALQMTYARALTVASLPRPPVTPAEACRDMAALLGHPAFHRLHPLRRANAMAAACALPGPRMPI